MKHRKVEPGTPEYAQVRRWFLFQADGGEGLSLRAALAKATALGWDVKRTALDGLRREILGQASANADVQARAVAAGRLPPGGARVGPQVRAPALPAPVAPAVAPAPRAPRNVEERLLLYEMGELQQEVYERLADLRLKQMEHVWRFGVPWTPPPPLNPPWPRYDWEPDAATAGDGQQWHELCAEYEALPDDERCDWPQSYMPPTDEAPAPT